MSTLRESQISFDTTPSRFTTKVIVSTAVLIIAGSFNTITFKVQTRNFGLKAHNVNIQTFFVLLGQFINLIIFYLRIFLRTRRRRTHFRKYKNKALMSGKQYQFSSWRIGIAGVIFCLGNMLQLYALCQLSPTLWQMLMGCIIIFTPLISRVTLKKRLYQHTVIGILLSVLALCLISLSSVVMDITKHDRHDATGMKLIWTIIMMIVGLFLMSIQRVYEEWLLNKVETSSFRFVGLEGLFGIGFITVLHVMFLIYNAASGSDLFDIGSAVSQVISSTPLAVTSVLLIISSTFYDMSGIILTKKVSATYRVVNDVSKTIVVWLAEIIIYDTQADIDNKWLYMLITVWKLLSYAILIFGNVLINEVTDISMLGLDKYFGKYNDKNIDESVMSESEDDKNTYDDGININEGEIDNNAKQL